MRKPHSGFSIFRVTLALSHDFQLVVGGVVDPGVLAALVVVVAAQGRRPAAREVPGVLVADRAGPVRRVGQLVARQVRGLALDRVARAVVEHRVADRGRINGSGTPWLQEAGVEGRAAAGKGTAVAPRAGLTVRAVAMPALVDHAVGADRRAGMLGPALTTWYCRVALGAVHGVDRRHAVGDLGVQIAEVGVDPQVVDRRPDRLQLHARRPWRRCSR